MTPLHPAKSYSQLGAQRKLETHVSQALSFHYIILPLPLPLAGIFSLFICSSFENLQCVHCLLCKLIKKTKDL